MDDKNQDRKGSGMQAGAMGSKGGQSVNINPEQIQKILDGMSYPASKDDLVQHARSHGADSKVMDALNSLPDQQFQTAADVSRAVGK